MSELFSVKGKVIVVTGGGKGVGWGITNGYLKAGASRVYIASRDEKALKQAADEFNKQGYEGKCIPLVANLATYDGVNQLAEELKKREKHINVLVNNSGNNWGAPYDEFPDSAWDRVLTLNVQRVFTLTQKLTPLLEASRGDSKEGPWADPARVIMIGSVDGVRVPSLETFSYSASKAALHQLTRVLAFHLGKRGITVNALACGPFESKMMAATLAAAKDSIVEGVPLRRIGEPDDVGGTCVFLSSQAGSYINGAIIPLDGGSLVVAKL
ncbi:short chain dehydrogenase/reductase family [Rhodotorula diobovata]|uniref:Short chain dehydrogenase/reductase family n=1 Tax=Rhodotorula diobovata TaxID=5288 RepID=A0A5C5G3J2_9BASI|nr:short chain dehydrogenase/reductase family [Rhodotorula diobovata]